MEIPLFNDILIIFGISIAVLFICHRLRIPYILGYLVTGALIGPFALGLISSYREVKMLSEIGIVLLLFSLGIEFSMKNLLRIGKNTVIGGTLQVVSTILVVCVVFLFMGTPVNESVFLGFLAALSSTAIVLKILQDKAELETPNGQLSVGILIFQDIVIVLMILIVPLLAGTEQNITRALLIFAAKSIGVILFILFGGQWIINRLLYYVTRTQSKELFFLVNIVICFSIAWLTYTFGLSLAFGAFLAGLVISNSEYSQQVLNDVLPFRVIFSSFFFISIGMMLDVSYFLNHSILVLTAFASIVVIKILLISASILILGYPLRVALLVGFTICQVGEFSFLLLDIGGGYNLIPDGVYQLFLNVAILTMFATPFFMNIAPVTSDVLEKLRIPKAFREGLYGSMPIDSGLKVPQLRDHVIVIGFGINGRNVARSSKAQGIPYLIVEMNPDTVRSEQKEGEPILYGDATQEAVLRRAGIERAKVLVCVIYDPAATRRIIAMSRSLNKNVHIIARTRFISEMVPLHELGADEVIPEEFETSIEIFSRVLNRFDIPDYEIDRMVDEIRTNGYRFYRSLFGKEGRFADNAKCIPGSAICVYDIGERSGLIERTLNEIKPIRNHDIDVLMIRRGDRRIMEPDGDTLLEKGDRLILQGSAESVSKIGAVLEDDSD
ncbi:MAG: cation:proton antiporter [Deltaproteobacteria bacterium]|nr:cation:proton antiporter [Candidatus Zymogenaceae bacterium]